MSHSDEVRYETLRRWCKEMDDRLKFHEDWLMFLTIALVGAVIYFLIQTSGVR